MMSPLETDYLIVGSGAVGMAFADTLLSQTDAQMIIVDRYPKPGGHWNVAYPFVTLHQPSQFYGVASKELSKGYIDQIGLNKGLNDLASGAEVSAYFDEVMRHTFLSSGRVQYFPMCNYTGNGEFRSRLSGQKYNVAVRKKIVDCTYLNTSVPATHQPNFTVAKNVQFSPINDLVKVSAPPAGFVIIGGGKTGIDACLWLLENHVDPDHLTWIMPRDAWLIDRANTQPTEDFFEQSIGTQAAQFEAIAQASSIEDLFVRLENAGALVRIDRDVAPQMFHAATISQDELTQLRRIKNIVRKGRVKALEQDKITLEKGSIHTSTEHLHIDCSASAIPQLAAKTVFNDNVIIPQTVRPYQPVFSASMIAYVEANYPDNTARNHLCQVVPIPNKATDWIPMTAAQMMNQFNWSQDKALRNWLTTNRLDGFSKLVRGIDKTDASKMAILKKMRDHAMPAMFKLKQFMDELEKSEPVM